MSELPADASWHDAVFGTVAAAAQFLALPHDQVTTIAADHAERFGAQLRARFGASHDALVSLGNAPAVTRADEVEAWLAALIAAHARGTPGGDDLRWGLGAHLGELLRRQVDAGWLALGPDPTAWHQVCLSFAATALEANPLQLADAVMQAPADRLLLIGAQCTRLLERARAADPARTFSRAYYARLHTELRGRWAVCDVAHVRTLWTERPASAVGWALAAARPRVGAGPGSLAHARLEAGRDAFVRLDPARSPAEQGASPALLGVLVEALSSVLSPSTPLSLLEGYVLRVALGRAAGEATPERVLGFLPPADVVDAQDGAPWVPARDRWCVVDAPALRSRLGSLDVPDLLSQAEATWARASPEHRRHLQAAVPGLTALRECARAATRTGAELLFQVVGPTP